MEWQEWKELNPEIEDKTAKIYHEISQQRVAPHGKGPMPTKEILAEPKPWKPLPDSDFGELRLEEKRQWVERRLQRREGLPRSQGFQELGP